MRPFSARPRSCALPKAALSPGGQSPATRSPACRGHLRRRPTCPDPRRGRARTHQNKESRTGSRLPLRSRGCAPPSPAPGQREAAEGRSAGPGTCPGRAGRVALTHPLRPASTPPAPAWEPSPHVRTSASSPGAGGRTHTWAGPPAPRSPHPDFALPGDEEPSQAPEPGPRKVPGAPGPAPPPPQSRGARAPRRAPPSWRGAPGPGRGPQQPPTLGPPRALARAPALTTPPPPPPPPPLYPAGFERPHRRRLSNPVDRALLWPSGPRRRGPARRSGSHGGTEPGNRGPELRHTYP